jgi:hypothetical protein
MNADQRLSAKIRGFNNATMLHLVIGRRQNRGRGEQLLHVIDCVEHVTRNLVLRFAGCDVFSFDIKIFAVNQYTPLRISSSFRYTGNVDMRILLDPDLFQPV